MTAAPVPPTEASATPDAPDPARRRSGLRWWREILYIVLIYIAYTLVRNQFGSGAGTEVDPGPAFNHAKAIIQLERNLGLYFERSLHQWYLDLPGHGLIRFWNVYYGLFHFVVAAGALIWLYVAAPARYRLWRNTLAITTLLALIGFAAFSLMPPRLLDDPGKYGGCQVYAGEEVLETVDEAGDPPCDRYGYVDTVAVYGGWASFGSEEMESVSNQYAAMPSMHIGWSMWCALVMVPLVRRRWLKVLVGAYPVFTLFDIILTANHYWIDGIGGLLCLGTGFLLARWGTAWWEARKGTGSGPGPGSASTASADGAAGSATSTASTEASPARP
ncbi:MAG TPA: phosphatase PAP2 family protein [Acidimicrobiales bacterium]